MHKNVTRWYEQHPETEIVDGNMVRGHPTVIQAAGGFLYLMCMNCYMVQSVDEIDAGLPVAPAKEVRE